MIRYTLCFSIATWLVAGGSLQAITITENFDDGSLDSNFTEFLSPGFEIEYVGGEAVFTRPAGPSNGAARIDSLFSLDGDFTITVDATRTSVTGALGLVTRHEPPVGDFTDVFFNGANFINANI